MPGGDDRLSRSTLLERSRFAIVLLALTIAINSCSFSNERIAVFSGTVSSSDSLRSVVARIDLAEIAGYVIYDGQSDGLLDDTVLFYGDEQGAFSGVLRYPIPANITAPWLRKHVRLLFPELNVDTFLTIDVYRADSELPQVADQWNLFILLSGN